MSKSGMPRSSPFVDVSPLWSRAPARDEQGRPYTDCMLLIPGLKKRDQAGIESCMVKIRHGLREFEHVVVYVDLNIRLGLLWVSAKPLPGITRHITQAIQREIPEARAVVADFNPESPRKARSSWLMTLRRKVSITLRLTRNSSGD